MPFDNNPFAGSASLQDQLAAQDPNAWQTPELKALLESVKQQGIRTPASLGMNLMAAAILKDSDKTGQSLVERLLQKAQDRFDPAANTMDAITRAT